MTHIRSTIHIPLPAWISGSDIPSPALATIGLAPEEAARSLRICLGHFINDEEIERAVG